ncbi:polyprenyl synthetase family protein [Paenibacillus sp. SI8]|uniref:polyprenyl synthetase family protein n=1 Tax=unclassified Paenibacillus TaxID=185978 RepID=UPI003467A855
MNQDTKHHMERIVDDCMFTEDLNLLLKAFITDKEQERSSWSQITLYTHYMLGGTSPHIHRIAAVTELMILCSDIIDDLQDQDQWDKAWMQCPQAVALNAVFALFTGVVGELGKLQVSERALVEISKIISRSLNGQHKDVTNAALTEDDYLNMTQEKSGSVFRLACFMGYSFVDCPDATIEQLHELADCLGLIHQIQNDMRDIVRMDEKSDLLRKKRTLPVLYLLLIEDEAFSALKAYYDGHMTEDFLLDEKEKILQMIQDSGCLEYSHVVQTLCLQKAEEIYTNLKVISPWKEKFKEITFASFLDARLS